MGSLWDYADFLLSAMSGAFGCADYFPVDFSNDACLCFLTLPASDEFDIGANLRFAAFLRPFYGPASPLTLPARH